MYYPYEGNKYLSFEAIEKFCYEIVDRFPQWVKLDEIGKTRQQRSIYLLTIGNHDEKAELKPAIWIDGGTHCAEWAGIMAAVYTVSSWLKAIQNKDPEIIHWFKHSTAYVVPCMSPDGFVAMMAGEPFIRSSLRKAPEGTIAQGFEPCDMNRDNQVHWMRWKHPAGPFVIDEELPLMMRPRTVDDSPDKAYFCSYEGEFKNWDGIRWTAAPLKYGLDLNRNFPSSWQPFSMFGMDGGDFALSEPESQAVVSAFSKRVQICAALTNHTYAGCILTQPYSANSKLKEDDINLMDTLASQLIEGTGYKKYKVYPEFVYKKDALITGVWSDTMSSVFGIPAYTIEFWNLFDYVGEIQAKPVDYLLNPKVAVVRKVLTQLIEKHPDIVEPWKSFAHAQLGEVEIGGIDYIRSMRNPPESVLNKECEIGLTIANRLRKAIPRVECNFSLEQVSPKIFKITAVLENTGFLPSSGLCYGQSIRSTPQVSFKLINADSNIRISGEQLQIGNHLKGWGNAITEHFAASHPIYPGLLHGQGHQSVATWVVEGSGTCQLQWIAGRAGNGQVNIELK